MCVKSIAVVDIALLTYKSNPPPMQLFPQLEEAMVTPLRTALEHYERVKETEDSKVSATKKVGGRNQPSESPAISEICPSIRVAMRMPT